jgi:hypothetical protein
MTPHGARPKSSKGSWSWLVVLGLLGAAGSTGCDPETKVVTMRIDHYRDPCLGSGPEFCIRVLESSDPTVAAPHRIEGFEHDWGYVYEVEVAVRDFGFSADASGMDYDLVDVLSREGVAPDATFTLPLTGDFIARVDTARFVLVGGLSADCKDSSVCLAVAEALHSDAIFDVELSHPTGSNRPFVAHAVTMRE